MNLAIMTDNGYESLEIERRILADAGIQMQVSDPPCRTEDDVIKACGDARVLMVLWAPMTRRVFESLPQVKCVVRYGIGVDNVDLAAAKDLGVCVANVPDFCVDEVSDHAMAMMLSLGRRMKLNEAHVLNGGWAVEPGGPGIAFRGRTLGLVGFGKISRRLAEKAKAFGLEILAYDPPAPEALFTELGVERVSLESLLSRSDIVSLHCPLMPETRHLMNRDTFALMKPGALLINTARGPVVNEPDMIEALRSGKLAAAGLDVFETEPLPQDSPLRGMDNVFLTAHVAAISDKSLERLHMRVAEAARDFMQGKRPASALV